MAEEKKIQLQTFTGAIDTDTADEFLSSDSYRYGQNIRILSSAGGKKGIVTNLKGTVEVEFTRPEGQNITIGAEESPEQNKLFFFEWNENRKHSIYYYDMLLNKVILILQNLTDTNNIDILQFKRRSLILHVDIVGDLIYYTDGQVKQKKINWKRALDKSSDGYGTLIIEEFINAYKPQPIFPPKLSYFTDTTRLTNYLYGNLFKASCRHIFRDGEISNYSEFSTVPLPQSESFSGNTSVSNQNNCLKISVETGSSDVRYIEIAIKIGNLDFVSITTLDKEELSISDNSLYVYSFYNDSDSFSGIDQAKINRAYSFMPRLPLVQKFVDRAMVYGGGIEGRSEVLVDLAIESEYSTLFVPDGTTNTLNSPFFDQTAFDHDFTREGNGRRRNSLVTLKIGNDVKAGNKFELFGRNGDSDNLYFTYTATGADDAISVANNFKQQLVATGRILSTSEDLPTTDIWTNTIVSGDVSFSFILRGRFAEAATSFTGNVNPVSVQTLKNNGQSVLNHKSGGSVKYGIIYWDEDTRRSQTYTSDDAFIRTSFVTETSGYKKVVHKLSIKHQPPLWAKYYEVVRTNDLTYGTSYIHILIQKAIESQSTTDTEYVDLVVGSLFTYQKMFPNTILKYNFEKNDRVRFIKKESDGSFYSFLETVVLDYNDVITDEKKEDITTNNSVTVTINGTTSQDNIGRYISINGVERLIINAPTGTTYTLDREYGTAEKYTSYKIIDRRGTIRVRKPLGVTIDDNSLVEVYKPAQNVEMTEKNFFLFGHKYAIKDWGTDNRCHTGDLQNQDPNNPSTVPAIVSIGNGMSYVRQRLLPTNNSVPGTQAITDFVEDSSFSDSYESKLNDNGKIAPQDNGSGEKRFGDRLRFSKNYIEDTKINGLNDFDNTDRMDYNDPFGSFRLLKFKKRLLYAFKDLNTGYIPVNATILRGDDGEGIGLSSSSKLLNELQYFSHEGGIGNMPMSFASGKTWYWFASPNSGTFCRIGGDGILPISEDFNLDSRLRTLLSRANKYGSFVFGGFDLENDEYVVSFEAAKESLYNAGFNEAMFVLYSEDNPVGTLYEVTTQPLHGTVTFDVDGNFVYTPTTDYTGPDYFYYRWKVPGGEWTAPKKECGNVNEQAIPTSPSIYYNAELSTNFTKAGCPDGYHGEVVPYVVPQYKYSSPYSQLNADQQAIDDINANGQNFANSNGDCILNAPGAFSFVAQTGLEPSTLTESNAITVSGTYSKYTISIDAGGEYQINGGSWTSASGVVNLGDSVKVRRTTSSLFNTAASTTLTIGSVTGTFTVTTRAANNVVVNYAMVFGSDPSVNHWNVIERTRDGVTTSIATIQSISSGTLPTGDFKEGDTIAVYQGAYLTFMWAPNSKVTLSMSANAVSQYSGEVTSQSGTQNTGLYVIPAGTTVIDISSIGSSTATGYLAKALLTENALTTGDAVINVSDNGEAGLGLLNLEPGPGSGAYSFNVKNDVNLLTVSIENTILSAFNYILEGEGGYIKSGSIGAGGTITHSDVTKGGLTITIGGNVGNEFLSQAFQKNDCSTGESGTYVTCSVAANTYFASTLAAANSLASDYITANGQALANSTGTCLVNTTNAVISVDMYDDSNLDVCAYIDTVGVAESGVIAARNGLNFYLPTDPAASAYILASDNIDQPTLKRRFVFNIGKLIAQYPDDIAIPEFIFKVRGRTSSPAIITGMWQREYPDVTMVMSGSPGSYIPTTTPTGGPPADSWSANVAGGGDGSVGIAVGSVILTFTYNRALNTISLTTA